MNRIKSNLNTCPLCGRIAHIWQTWDNEFQAECAFCGVRGRSCTGISKYSFLRYIYENENAPYLKRKRDLALNFINAVENDNSAMKIITRIYYDHAFRIHTD